MTYSTVMAWRVRIPPWRIGAGYGEPPDALYALKTSFWPLATASVIWVPVYDTNSRGRKVRGII